MRLFGVINASPDSLNDDSIVRSPGEAAARADLLRGQGVWGFDLGGQGSTFVAGETSVEEEWARLAPLLPVLAARGVPISVDTWRPETARRSLANGATWLNAADGLQQDEMLEVAAAFGCPVVLPFLSGPDPLRMDRVAAADPVEVLLEFFEHILRRADAFGIRDNVVIDPGTGFAPHDWPWEERFVYQKLVYSQLDRLRVFGLPLYIALPWKDTAQHAELLDIVIGQDPEYGRAHYPDRIRAAEEAHRVRVASSGALRDRDRPHA
ncbi:MAG: dihydropteroate synthase [Acidimicrobiia bacterium]